MLKHITFLKQTFLGKRIILSFDKLESEKRENECDEIRMIINAERKKWTI